ncbi:hypothetical protein B5C34_10135 [Pacificimonas flava]|uniref:Uncharacterized protein n=2 Tax=Pacificimonas TaxID=1960290 RepID=A0A219B6P1_9SPHN|nr:hypothetical protein B5C34_10135 [Pacificimonas flava]
MGKKLRLFLILLAWSGAIGGMIDGLITLYAAWEIAKDANIGIGVTVETHISMHLPILYFLKEVGYALAPNALIDWIFALPALLYFPFRVLVNLLFGWIMLKWANRLEVAEGDLAA